MICSICSTTVKGHAAVCSGCGAELRRSHRGVAFGLFMVVLVAPASWQGNWLSGIIAGLIGLAMIRAGMSPAWHRKPEQQAKQKTYPHQYEHWF